MQLATIHQTRKSFLPNGRLGVAFFLFLLCHTLHAYVPDGYYATIDGKRSVELKAALNAVIAPHAKLGYGSLWSYYYLTYTHPDNRQRVLDMYSDNEYYFNSTVAVANMNREHSVPKSWWEGGETVEPGYDLYNVIPSDATANGKKSNNPMGIVTDPNCWTNGVTKVGKGTTGGVTTTFFEPDDRYKGDFARIYFYMATCYPDLKWQADKGAYMSERLPLTIADWILPTLISWNNADPVDEEEILRNENVAAIQHNRNPFVDYPQLVDYIWGSKRDEAFVRSNHHANQTAQSTFYAAVPIFSVAGGTADSPKDLATGSSLTIKGSTIRCTLHYRIDNGAWRSLEYSKGYNKDTETTFYIAPEQTLTIDHSTCIEAYCTQAEREPSEHVCYYYNAVNYSERYLLYEDFAGTAGNSTNTNGSSSAWSGNANFTSTVSAYCAGNAIRIGNGSGKGSITSRQLDFDGGTVNVFMDVKGWTSIEGNLNVSVTGSRTQVVKYTATMADEWEHLSLTFEGVSARPAISISTTAKRAFIDRIAVEASSSSGVNTPAIADRNHYYTTHGQRLDGTPTLPGIYIVNGKKLLVK